MPDWISVKDRQPALHEEVLIHYLNGTILIGNRFRFGYMYEDLYGKVTHWMPLPDSPI